MQKADKIKGKSYAEHKYHRMRQSIEDGDIIVVRGLSILPRIIEWADQSYYSHALVAFKAGKRLLCIQSMADGVQPYYLSTEIAANVDFCIIKPNFSRTMVKDAMNIAFDKAQAGIPYNDWELPRILLNKKLGIKFKNIQGNKHDAICSVFAGKVYAGLFPIKAYWDAYKKQGYLTPQDLIRYGKISTEVTIIGNNPR